MMDESWQLVLEFPDQSASFVHGFEAGQLWYRLSVEYDPIQQVINEDNREIIVRMAAAKGWIVTFEAISDGWLTAKLERGRGPTLSVVS